MWKRIRSWTRKSLKQSENASMFSPRPVASRTFRVKKAIVLGVIGISSDFNSRQVQSALRSSRVDAMAKNLDSVLGLDLINKCNAEYSSSVTIRGGHEIPKLSASQKFN